MAGEQRIDPLMRRRQLLGGIATAGAVALSGCTEPVLEATERKPPIFEPIEPAEIELPMARQRDIVARALEEAARASIPDIDALETVLVDAGVDVQFFEETTVPVAGELREDLTVTYIDHTAANLLPEVGYVTGAFAALVAGGSALDVLHGHIRSDGGKPYGAFEVERVDAEAYLAGEKSARSYGDIVLGTLKTDIEG
ncbi:hypothetical protein ACNS7O_00655 [Haloferacaceae archaeon DSL9]